MRDAGVGTVAMEVSSHALEQHRVDGTHFAAACFTNLSHDHLDYHGTMDAYFAAKARLFDGAFTTRAAITSSDPRGRALAAAAAAAGMDVWTFAIDDEHADVHARDVELTPEATRFTLVSTRDDETARHRVARRCSDRSTSRTCSRARRRRAAGGLPWDAVVAGLGAPVVVPGRIEPVDAGQDFRVLVDYAHTPDALERVLVAARPLAGAGWRGRGRVRLRRRPRPGQAPADGCRRGALRRSGLSHVRQPAFRGSRRDRRRRARGRPGRRGTAPRGSGGRARSPARDRATRSPRRSAGDVVVIAGKGHETGQIVGERDPAVRRPHRRPRSAWSRCRATDGCGDREACRRRSRRRRPEVVVTSWGFDSRALAPGACFVALTDRPRRPRLRQRRVRAPARAWHSSNAPCRSRAARATRTRWCGSPNVLRGLQDVARSVRRGARRPRRRRRHRSTGKTSTKDLLAAALPPGRCLRQPGVVQQRVRAPDHAAQRAGARARRGRGDGGAVPGRRRVPVRDRTAAVRRRHQRRLGPRRAPRRPRGHRPRARASWWKPCPPHGAVVLNADDEWTPWLRDRSAAPVVTVGFAPDADAPDHGCGGRRPTCIPASRSGAAGSGSGCTARTRCTMPRWRAVAANVAHGVPFADSAARIADARGSRWRMELVETPDGLVVLNDAYNANPASMDAALRALRPSRSTGRRIAVLGDMRELGAHSDDRARVRSGASRASSASTSSSASGGRRARSRLPRPARPSMCTPCADADGALRDAREHLARRATPCS